ncbi:MAG: HAD-IIIC family phosphatase [Candidatus Omnitrophota bacterium]
MPKNILKHRIKNAIEKKDYKKAYNLTVQFLDEDLHISELIMLDKFWQKNINRASEELMLKPLHLAVTGSYTLDTIVSVIRLFLLKDGYRADIYQSDYGVFQQEIINKDSALYAFNPHIILLFIGYRDVKDFPSPGMSFEEINKMIEIETSRYSRLWQLLSERLTCHIIQNNFDVPLERTFGELETKYPWTKSNYLRRLNLRLGEVAPSFVSILDIEHLSAKIGKECWFDERFYYHSKQGISFDCISAYVKVLVALVKATIGDSKKCLVFDLDNTLWGGVIGEVGLENIEFGIGSAQGEAYLAFAKYIKSLKDKGVILAVCSKNDEKIAKEPFRLHPEMPIKLEDIACFMANWEDKATNLRRIAKELNIGLDSIVFLDDDIVERKMVRAFCPEVTVVELKEDPSLQPRFLDSKYYFETISYSKEDADRTNFYLTSKRLQEIRADYSDLPSFLKSLKMVGKISRFNESDLKRIVQLINKTNQFNLMTRRYTEMQVRNFMKNNNCITLSVRLKDKYSDYGLISVFIGNISEKNLIIDTWVMSCRVFSRTTEYFLFNYILYDAIKRGINKILGTYIPTKKNLAVKDLFQQLSFNLDSKSENGTTNWSLRINQDLPLKETYIKAATLDE